MNLTNRAVVNRARLTGHSREAGSTLAICLIFLLLVTILGMSAIKTTTLQDKMGANTRDKDLAFQAAETALKVAEAALATGGLTSFDASCTGGLCLGLDENATIARWEDPDICGAGQDIWSCDKSRALSNDDALDSNIHAKQPRFFVEPLGTIDKNDNLNMVNIGESITLGDIFTVYRITAIGYGGSISATAVLQSTYVKPNKY